MLFQLLPKGITQRGAKPQQSGGRGEPVLSKILNIDLFLGEDLFGGFSLERGQKLINILESFFPESK